MHLPQFTLEILSYQINCKDGCLDRINVFWIPVPNTTMNSVGEPVPQTLNMLFWNQCSRPLLSTIGTRSTDVLYQLLELDPQPSYINHRNWILRRLISTKGTRSSDPLYLPWDLDLNPQRIRILTRGKLPLWNTLFVVYYIEVKIEEVPLISFTAVMSHCPANLPRSFWQHCSALRALS